MSSDIDFREKISRWATTRRRGLAPIKRLGVTLILAECLVLAASTWFGGYTFSASPAPVEVLQSAPATQLRTSEAETVKPSAPTDPIKGASLLINQGRFHAAAEYIDHVDKPWPAGLEQVKQLVSQYEQIDQRRLQGRGAAYQKQLDELEKLKRAAATAGPQKKSPPPVADANAAAKATSYPDELEFAPEPNDPNDPNDPATILAAVARAAEFATNVQKKRLLADPFVVQSMQTAVELAGRLELQGKWLEAYTDCYYWLLAVDPNNKGYSAYADDLVDKAAIALSFQDSPCETRRERYEGVDKTMFARALDALNVHYVSTIDYRQMATKAIKRCKLLSEVVAVTAAHGKPPTSAETAFPAPSQDELTAWSVALDGLLDDVNQPSKTVDKGDIVEILDKVLGFNAATIELPRQVLIAQFTEAALGTLDPYTVMVWPKQVEDFEKLMMNEFTGIGIEISKAKGLLTVASLLPDTPAYKAGLDADDVVEAVNGVSTKDMSLTCAVRKITGPKGTEVTLTIKRAGEDKTRTITLTRDRIVVPTVRGWQRTGVGNWLYMIDPNEKIGYVRLTGFSAETASHLEKVLDELEAEGLRALILDLRFNSGGLLDSAVKVVDKFIESGLIVRTQPRLNMVPNYEFAHRAGTHPPYPLVILVNSASASASEIVAGALADPLYERATLVGTRTHGKGSVQGIMPYPGGGAELKYTMAYYHLPSGQRVKSREDAEKDGRKDWGVAANVDVELRSDEMKTMLEVQRDNDVLVQAGRTDDRPALHKHSLRETLDSDPQLAVGLLVAEAKLAESASAVATTK